MSVCSSLHLLTRAHCARYSPSIPLWLASHILAPAGGRTTSPNCALRIPVSRDQRRVCLSFLLLHQAVWAWCRSRFQQSDPRSPTTKLICSNSHQTVRLFFLLHHGSHTCMSGVGGKRSVIVKEEIMHDRHKEGLVANCLLFQNFSEIQLRYPVLFFC